MPTRDVIMLENSRIAQWNYVLLDTDNKVIKQHNIAVSVNTLLKLQESLALRAFLQISLSNYFKNQLYNIFPLFSIFGRMLLDNDSRNGKEQTI